MEKSLNINLKLTNDGPNSIDFEDTYEGLNDKEWYKFEANEHGGVLLQANAEGFEHLARYFFKLARGQKDEFFHTHHALELGQDSNGEPELTVMVRNDIPHS